MARLGEEDPSVVLASFAQKPALHRFPNKYATLTQQMARAIAQRYGGDSSRIWTETSDVTELGNRLLELPAFGVEKTNWTVGMLGRLGWLPYDGWQEYRASPPKRSKR
jgi:uncharacterized HhH-GPD family protein